MSKKPRIVVFDCDDAILDWTVPFRDWHNYLYGSVATGRSKDYKLSAWLGTHPDLLDQRIKEFNHSYMFGCLPPMKYAVDVIEYIREYNVGREVEDQIHMVIVTKCGNADITKALRLANLHNVFGDVFASVIFLNNTDSKRESLADLQSKYEILMFIDDYVGNALVGHDLGINSVVFLQDHNEHMRDIHSELPFCKDWMDAFSRFLAKHMIDGQ